MRHLTWSAEFGDACKPKPQRFPSILQLCKFFALSSLGAHGRDDPLLQIRQRPGPRQRHDRKPRFCQQCLRSGRAGATPCSSPHVVPRIWLAANALPRARARNTLLLFLHLAWTTCVRFSQQCDAPRPRTISRSTSLLCLPRLQCNAKHRQAGQVLHKLLPNTAGASAHKELHRLTEVGKHLMQ
jgi:hypothetical protein